MLLKTSFAGASSPTGLLSSPALAVSISSARVVCVLENGSVEVVKFGISDAARSAIAAATSRNKHRSRDGTIDSDDLLPLAPSISADIMSTIPEPLIHLEQEPASAPELLGKVPVPCNIASERLTSVLLITPSGRYALSAGKVDGSVSVRELDHRSGYVKSEGDFRSHRSAVLHLSADTIPNATTDVVASCDANGLVFVWTVSEIRHQIGNQLDLFERESVISRRPQRMFRCRPCSDICCDISCKMGIVVACCGVDVHVFSIERDERLRLFQAVPAGAQTPCQGAKRTIRRLSLCNDGIIVLHVEVHVSPLVDGFETAKEHRLEAYSLSGSFVAERTVAAPVTFLQCPCREDMLLTGHLDGSVNVYCSHNLELVFTFYPHASFLLATGPDMPQPSLGADNTAYPSPVLCVKVGPSLERPTLLAVSCQSGDLYLRALPDFVKWERQRSPSALVQLVERPLEVVRGTIQQAHQIGTTIHANVQGLATNASRLADDAMTELKKTKLGAAVSSFFKK